MKRWSLIIAAFFFLSHPANAQGLVSGRVSDKDSQEPLPGVYVIYGKGTGTSTDADGLYSFSGDTGKIEITFRFLGYKTVTETVRVEAKKTARLDVYLETESQLISQIVVSADRMEQKESELTVSMDVIKADLLTRSHITDAQELITKTPGIEVLDGQASIRGGSGYSYGVGSRVLALIDGLPMMSGDAGNIKWSFLPLENLSQVEIIKGASSVLYGSSALNGVINFRTADASNIPLTQFYAEGGVFDVPSNEEWKWWDTPRVFANTSFSHLQKFGRNDIGVGLNLATDRGYRKFNEENLGRISFRLKHHSSKTPGLKYGLNLNAGTTYKTDFILWEDATTGALKQDTSTVSTMHGYFFTADPFITFGGAGKIKHDFRMRYQYTANKFPVRTDNDASSSSIYGEYLFYYQITGFLKLTAGVSENWSNITSNFYGDHRGLNVAGFAQLEVRPVSSLKIIGGLRIEQNSLDDERDGIVPVFRAGINFQAAEYTFIRASFGQGYRYPSIAEKYASTTLGSVRIFPSPYVKAESGWSSEIGIKQGVLLGKMMGEGDLSLFFSQNTDMIEYVFGIHQDPSTGTSGLGFKATNVEQSRVYGGEIEFMLKRSFGEFVSTVTGGYTYIYPVEFNSYTSQNTDIYLKYRRKHSAKISLISAWRSIEGGLDLYARSKTLNIDDVFLNPATREVLLPGFYDYWLENNTGYFFMDGNIGYRIREAVKVSFAVKNISNTEYMGRPGDIQPHRNYSIRLSGSF
jgi:outer membrane cobalamin receptor